MPSNPTHGYDTTPSNNGNNEGVVPTVLSYVGLGGNNQSASDATAEPAFGASVGPNAGTRDGYGAPTLNPHDEERAKVVADRAVGGTSSIHDSNEGGMRADARVGDSNLGGGSSNSGFGSGAGSGTATGVDPGDVGSEPHRQSAAGFGSGLGSDSHRQSGVGSGVGLDSSRGSGAGLGSERSGSGVQGSDGIAAGDELTDSHKGNRAAEGDSEGATAGEAQASTERSEYNKKPGKQQLENKSAIPVAGGIQLGEKHWGESNIIPDNPKPREESGGVSSASGQPDQSTKDNTAANTGNTAENAGNTAENNPSNQSGSGEQKEGFMDKVKDKLNIGNDSKQIGSNH